MATKRQFDELKARYSSGYAGTVWGKRFDEFEDHKSDSYFSIFCPMCIDVELTSTFRLKSHIESNHKQEVRHFP